jgi:ribosomal protein S14
MPRNGSANAAFARSPIACSRCGNSKGLIAGVGALCRKPKCADSPAILGPPCSIARCAVSGTIVGNVKRTSLASALIRSRR